MPMYTQQQAVQYKMKAVAPYFTKKQWKEKKVRSKAQDQNCSYLAYKKGSTGNNYSV